MCGCVSVHMCGCVSVRMCVCMCGCVYASACSDDQVFKFSMLMCITFYVQFFVYILNYSVTQDSINEL